MTDIKKCPKCGYAQIMNDVQVVDLDSHAENLAVQVQQKPQARLFKGGVRVPLKAQVCGTCGYTELYAKDPTRLLEAHEQAG